MTIADYVQKLPEDEREELIKFLADEFRSLSPTDKGFVKAHHVIYMQSKVAERGGMVTEEDIMQQNHEKLVQKVPELQRIAAKHGNTALYRDLEKYRETPEVAILKHHSLRDFVQLEKEEQRQQQE
jgi:uncharacterized protein (DUF2235 family)